MRYRKAHFGSQFLTFSLKLSIETKFLMSHGIICHTSEAKHLIEFRPYWLVQALLLKKSNCDLNPLNAKFTKWSNTLKQSVGNLPTNCLNVFDHFVGLAFKGLTVFNYSKQISTYFNIYNGISPPLALLIGILMTIIFITETSLSENFSVVVKFGVIFKF